MDATADGLERLNRECYCITVDHAALRRRLDVEMGAPGTADALAVSHPNLFASHPVFLSRRHVAAMAGVVQAVETVTGMASYREAVLQWAPDIAALDPGSRGVFFGYDFHLGPDGPRLIEINTNAGGALLNAALARAQRACCPAMADLLPGSAELDSVDSAIVGMFVDEWRLQRGARPLKTVAIVDDDPPAQFLHPEFVLFERLFQRAGIEAVIADPSTLALREDALWHADRKIDLVYNRLTDFPLAQPRHAHLRSAYESDRVVLTPHPRAHALYADKRNLALLTDPALLRAWGVHDDVAATLSSGIATTRIVRPADADALWAGRRKLFFKPASGYGSKAAYRGDKLTSRVWDTILAGRYVAQEYVPPSERGIQDGAAPLALKLDLRNYVYVGRVQLLAARLYQGQTTNFRTARGGFATVFYPAGSLP